ncbi:hypothetical protein [Deinococcus sonorensis]|uniref:Uncharacterized protein n=1 Tax=Deinococcus sonorensis TaxID=309891 RepID=A0ABV8YAI6_9DEIO
MSDSVELGPLTAVRAFVEDAIDGPSFAATLFTDTALELLLRAAPPIPPYSSHGADNLYQFLIELNFDRERDLLDAHDALARWLTLMGVPHVRATTLSQRAALRKKVQPKWLNIDEDVFRVLLEAAGDRQGAALQTWLKEELRARFRSIKRPPQWLQSPQWPVREGVPLVFVGQLAADGLLHDDATVYVFMHPQTGVVETVVQVA